MLGKVTICKKKCCEGARVTWLECGMHHQIGLLQETKNRKNRPKNKSRNKNIQIQHVPDLWLERGMKNGKHKALINEDRKEKTQTQTTGPFC